MNNFANTTKVAFKKKREEKETAGIKEVFPFFIVRTPGVKDQLLILSEDKQLMIGRRETSEICLIKDEQVSRNHSLITVQSGIVKVTDQGSTNGTIVNGRSVKEKTLEDGDELLIGSTQIQFYVPTSVGDSTSGIALRTHNYFETRLKEELDRTSRYDRSLSLMMIALDDKTIVKDLGKTGYNAKKKTFIGNLVMTLRNMIRTMDILACYASDEIELMLPETTKDEAFLLAQRIHKESMVNLKVPVNIGIASYPEDALSQELLIDKTRQAMKLSKLQKGDKIADIKDSNIKTITVPNQNIIVKNEKNKQIFDMVNRVAGSNISVLVQGETGVGKEIIAEAVHYNSPRKDKPLVSVNCAAITETILESELFGHEKGSFTGADRLKIGLFETAKGGTVFLDEISEMPVKIQAKLLRVLQNRKIMRVGSSTEIDVDVRVVAATNRNLEECVEKGHFREDLFYRLNAITIIVPPLRERKDEIPPLVQLFTEEFSNENGKKIKGISPEAIALITKYDWPGNIRELRNCIERAVVVAEGDMIYKEHLAAKVFKAPIMKRPLEEDNDREFGTEDIERETTIGDMRDIVQSYEKKIIINALKKVNWNQTKAADILKIPRRTLVSKIKKYDIEKE